MSHKKQLGGQRTSPRRAGGVTQHTPSDREVALGPATCTCGKQWPCGVHGKPPGQFRLLGEMGPTTNMKRKR